MSAEAFDDDRFDENFFRWWKNHAVTILKVPLIALMLGFSAMMLSNSVFKGLAVAVAVVFLSAFGVWRRFLEPMSFWAFLISIIVWCDPQIVRQLVSVFK